MAQSIQLENIGASIGGYEILHGLDLEISEGEFLVLLGESGCGKSTLLNIVAGLNRGHDGVIRIGGRDVTMKSPKERDIGMVFQSYALYPQMTVAGNMSFGLKMLGLPRDEIRSRVGETAEMLGLTRYLKRKPRQLSGGQKQRVAIGRALARRAGILLFDEPFSNLDAKLRVDLRAELRQIHNNLGMTVIYVTHDQTEAMSLANRIAIMRAGAIEQVGTPHSIYTDPSNRYVAEFMGTPAMNFIDGTLSTDGEMAELICGDARMKLPRAIFRDAGVSGRPVCLGIRPEHIKLHPSPATADFQAKISDIEQMGSFRLVWTHFQGMPISVLLTDYDETPSGTEIGLSFDMSRAFLFDAQSGLRI